MMIQPPKKYIFQKTPMSSLKQISQKSLKTDKNFHTETPSVYPKHIKITSQTHKINNQDEKDIEHTNK